MVRSFEQQKDNDQDMMQTILENLMESMEDIKANQAEAIVGINEILELMSKDKDFNNYPEIIERLSTEIKMSSLEPPNQTRPSKKLTDIMEAQNDSFSNSPNSSIIVN